LSSVTAGTVIFFKQSEGSVVNWDRIEGNWKQFKGRVQEQWGKLTDDQLEMSEGKRDRLMGKIQETYGVTREHAEQELSAWEQRQRDIDGGAPVHSNKRG